MFRHLNKMAFLIGLIVICGRRTVATKDSCLLLGGNYDSGILNVDTGVYTQTPLLSDNQLPTMPILPHAISGDRKHIAIIDLAITDDSYRHPGSEPHLPITLTVQTLAQPLPLGQSVVMGNSAVATDAVELYWSPDNQWIVYRWRTPQNMEYVGIADATGKKLHEKQVDIPKDGRIQFDSWSADSKYFDLLEITGQYPPAIEVSIWSAPELALVEGYSQPITQAAQCRRAEDNMVDYDYEKIRCLDWTPTDHQAAYISGNPDHPQLIMSLLDRRIYRRFALPTRIKNVAGETTPIPSLLWSPDSKYIAVGLLSYLENDQSPPPFTRLDIYGIDGSAQLAIDTVGHNYIYAVEGLPTAVMVWAADSKSLFYSPDYNSGQNPTFKVLGYDLDTRQKHTYLTGNAQSVIELAPSPDNKALAIADESLYFTTFDGIFSSQLGAVDHMMWSGSLLAAVENDSSDVYSIKVRIYRSDGYPILSKTIHFMWGVNEIIWTNCD